MCCLVGLMIIMHHAVRAFDAQYNVSYYVHEMITSRYLILWYKTVHDESAGGYYNITTL